MIGNRVIEAVEVIDADKKAHTMPCRRMIAVLGFTANLGPLLRWASTSPNLRHIPVDPAMQTNIPEVFAAATSTTPGQGAADRGRLR